MTKKTVKDTTPTQAVVKLSEVPPIEFVTSGVKEVDELVGGFPRGRVTQVYGLSGVGKTTLMVKCLAAMSQSKARVLYIDVENAINIDRVKELGADLTQIDYSNLTVLEEVCELVKHSIDTYDIVVVDSVAMLTPLNEHTGVVGEQHVGLKPRLLGQWLRMIEGPLGRSKCALILVNQMRRTMEMYGEKYVLPGGLQLKFSSSLMLQLSTASKDKLMDGKEVKGHWINVRVTKNKVGKPELSTKFKLLYN